MKVLMVEPGKVPYITELGDKLEAMQDAVGGYIQAMYPFMESAVLVCNEDGKINDLPLNRAMYDDYGEIYDVIAGNFFIAGLGEEDFTDLPDDLAQKFYEQFKHPESFVRTARGIEVIKQPIQTQTSNAETAPKPKHPGRSV